MGVLDEVTALKYQGDMAIADPYLQRNVNTCDQSNSSLSPSRAIGLSQLRHCGDGHSLLEYHHGLAPLSLAPGHEPYHNAPSL